MYLQLFQILEIKQYNNRLKIKKVANYIKNDYINRNLKIEDNRLKIQLEIN